MGAVNARAASVRLRGGRAENLLQNAPLLFHLVAEGTDLRARVGPPLKRKRTEANAFGRLWDGASSSGMGTSIPRD